MPRLVARAGGLLASLLAGLPCAHAAAAQARIDICPRPSVGSDAEDVHRPRRRFGQQLFEGFSKKIVDAVQANPEVWQDTAILITFDEGGGYSDHVSILKFIERNWHLKPVTFRSRDNLPNPIVERGNPYVPVNTPAISDLFDLFDFGGRWNDN